MQEQGSGKWVRSRVAGIAYCGYGQHFVQDGDTVWRFFVTPLLSRECICEKHAEEATSDEQA